MFSNTDLKKLLIPLIIEQVLTALIGTVDTMMVSAVGAEAVSGVSLVNALDTLMIYLFSALATGGAIVCAQNLGANNRRGASSAAQQVYLAVFLLSLLLCAFCLCTRTWLLRALFGTVEAEVMQAARTYFLITILSYPFIGLYNGSAALYRAAGNSRLPMYVALATNLVNVLGNAVLMFGCGLGVAGAALATLSSRALGGIVMMVVQQRPNQPLAIGNYLKLRPQWRMIGTILRVGVPTGVENSLFMVGRLAIQTTVSTLGTTAIAAQAIVNILEVSSSYPSMAIGLALTTVAGQCIGAGEPEQARRYIKKLCCWSWCILLGVSLLILAITKPVTILAGMSEESAALCCRMMLLITLIKPMVWVQAFTLPSGMRAAGDVTFAMAVSILSMWAFRVWMCTFLCRYLGFGILGVWIGMFSDWFMRGCIYLWRFRSRKWIHASLAE